MQEKAVTRVGGSGSSEVKTTHCSIGPPSAPAPTACAGRLAGAEGQRWGGDLRTGNAIPQGKVGSRM